MKKTSLQDLSTFDWCSIRLKCHQPTLWFWLSIVSLSHPHSLLFKSSKACENIWTGVARTNHRYISLTFLPIILFMKLFKFQQNVFYLTDINLISCMQNWHVLLKIKSLLFLHIDHYICICIIISLHQHTFYGWWVRLCIHSICHARWVRLFIYIENQNYGGNWQMYITITQSWHLDLKFNSNTIETLENVYLKDHIVWKDFIKGVVKLPHLVKFT